MTRLEEIEARLAAATPGPWGSDHISGGQEVCDCGYNVHVRPFSGDVRKGSEGAMFDATLIAHAPADLRLLLDQVHDLQAALHRDQTGLAASLDAVRKAAEARTWLLDGRGPYAWDDDGYRKEAGLALNEIIRIALGGLRESGKRARVALAESDFPPARTARELLERLPIINDPIISAAMAAIEDDESEVGG